MGRPVKLANKICNLRDITANPTAEWSKERKREYFERAMRVVAGLRDIHPGLERAFDEVCEPFTETVLLQSGRAGLPRSGVTHA